MKEALSPSAPKERNPFRPGNGIVPPYLAGRDAMLSSFTDLLDENLRGLPRNMILYGLRGTGKTVLLQTFKQICESRSWSCVTREFSERFRDEEIFTEAFLQDLTRAASEVSFGKRVKEMGKRVANYVKPEEISVSEISYKPFYKSSKTLLEDHLRDHLIENWKKIFAKSKDKTNGLVFLYDEFHTIKDDPSSKNFPLASMLAALSEAQREGCRYILVVCGLPNIRSNMKDAKTYVERMFRFEEAGNLDRKDAERAIREPLRAAGIEFDRDLVDAIVEETNGYPYFLQYYCYYIIDRVNKPHIALADFNASLRRGLLAELDRGFFEDRFRLASDTEQKVLFAMARAGGDGVHGEVRTSAIRRIARHEPYASLMTSLARLIEKNLIYKSRKGEYGFALPLFRDFLLRQTQQNNSKS